MARFAGVLAGLGVGRGDRVVVYMPMVPEAAIAMLACARLGAVHSVVFGGFAPRELAIRIDDATPEGDRVRVLRHRGQAGAPVQARCWTRRSSWPSTSPSKRVILQRPQVTAEMGPDDVDWAEAMASAEPAAPVTVAATDPLYILYTSGTTAKPKGVVRDTGGYAVAMAWTMANLYDIGPGETMFTASDVGWVVGHSYIVYAPLIVGATTIIYEGKPVGTPDAGQFWRVIAEHGAKAMFTAPTAFRAIKKEDPKGALLGQYDLSHMRYLFLAGERLDPETYHWASDLLGIPVIDHWWQTETGWAIWRTRRGSSCCRSSRARPRSRCPAGTCASSTAHGRPGRPARTARSSSSCRCRPARCRPCGTTTTATCASYLTAFDGYYLTGDGGHIDEDGYVYVMGRTDDVINVAGHRLSTGGMEEVLASHPRVAECAVIGVADPFKGQVPRGFVVLKAGVDRPEEELRAELVAIVRERIGAVASLREVGVVKGLPKTRSGKILRKTMRGIADGLTEPVPSTIDDVGARRPAPGAPPGTHQHPPPTGMPAQSRNRHRCVATS